VEILNNSWQIQISHLADAYLIWSQDGAQPVVEELGGGNPVTWEIMTIDFFSTY
jgi:hypothetical protein